MKPDEIYKLGIREDRLYKTNNCDFWNILDDLVLSELIKFSIWIQLETIY